MKASIWGPKKTSEQIKICVLTPRYYKTVVQIGSMMATLPYNDTTKTGWYMIHPFKKMRGYITDGFKMDWPKEKRPYKAEMFAWFDDNPLQTVFMSEEILQKIKNSEKKACVVVCSSHTMAKYKNPIIGKTSYHAYIADAIEKELSDEEVTQVKSISAFIFGGHYT